MVDKVEYTVVCVEDEKDIRDQIVEFLSTEEFEFGTLRVIAEASFDRAIELLRQRKVDLLLLDVFRGDPTRSDSPGVQILEEWRTTGFAPVILHTALPEAVANQAGPFVRIVPKGIGNLGLTEVVESSNRANPPAIWTLTALRTYMWSFLR